MNEKENEANLRNECDSAAEKIDAHWLDGYGFTVDDAYRKAVIFYRDQERNNHLPIDYQQRLRFMALSKQAKYGTFCDDAVDCGWFDIVGNDAKKAWKAIGNLSTVEAMLEFIRILDLICPTFRVQLQTQRKIDDKSSTEHLNCAISDSSLRFNHLVGDVTAESREVLEKFEEQKNQIQEALNRQTYHQFLAYAQQTHPGESPKQEQLIKQLQEQHYQQYMSQVYAQAQAVSQAAVAANPTPNISNLSLKDPETGLQPSAVGIEQRSSSTGKIQNVDETADETNAEDESDVSDEEGADSPPNPKIAPATMWTAKNVQEFKDNIRKEGTDGVLKIGHGETVTVRVPTHPEGSSLFWEFATDYYDLGFGVYFEWTVAETNQVTVHVEESEDDYDEEEAVEGANTTTTTNTPGDVEAAAAKKQRDLNKPRCDEIIPTFRRDCHEDVFSGSHVYPGRGVYLLKFDNSYSLWRSKTLYYRVFYSK